MSKKIILSIFTALLLAILLSTTAFAQAGSDRSGKIGRRVIGELTAVTGSELSFKTLKGVTLSIQVDSGTVYRDQNGNIIALGDIQVGKKITVAASSSEQGIMVARLVMILPDDFVKGDAHLFRRAKGVVIAVNDSSFTLRTRNNEDLSFLVDSGTTFLGEARSLAEVKVGMQGGVIAVKRSDKTLLALAVRLGSPISRFAGQVTDVDPTGMTLSLHTRSGEDLTFNVTASTVLWGKDGKLDSLADIQTGMIAAVAAVKQPDGSYTAQKIGAVDKKDIPNAEFRNLGKVTSVGDDTFTIKVRGGKEITYAVTSDTHFPGQAKSLADLKPGMVVLVSADQVGDELVALVIRGR